MSPFFRVSAFFFAFPLLSPTVGGVVLYPFLLYALWHGTQQQLPLRSLPLLLAGAFAALAVALVDLGSALRFVAFGFALLFLHLCARDRRRMQFLLALGAAHAAVVIGQWLLVIAGFEIDFSKLVGALYGDLLPPTGLHIDYNAFSQLDVFVPRVAGLNREPAFASVLFTGLAFMAARLRRRWLFVLFAVAVGATLSKIVFPLIAALLLVWSASSGRDGRVSSSSGGVLWRLAVFTGLHAVLVYLVYLNLEAVQLAMALDASFYHRFIGLHTFATQWEELAVLGNSMDRIADAAIFQDYEFLADRRAFLDGSVVSKLVIDFGYLGLAAYALVVASVARSSRHVLAVAVGGIFINLLSVSPATVLLFWLLLGMGQRSLAAPFSPRRHARTNALLFGPVRPATAL